MRKFFKRTFLEPWSLSNYFRVFFSAAYLIAAIYIKKLHRREIATFAENRHFSKIAIVMLIFKLTSSCDTNNCLLVGKLFYI